MPVPALVVTGMFFSPLIVSMIALRRLDRDRIGDPGLRIEPIGRRGLRAAGERGLHRRRRILLAQTDQAGQRAVDIDVQGRLLEGLLDPRIGDAGDLLDPRQQLVGVFPVRLQVVADDLQVDRRGHAEIQDLADHVGRQEGEGGAGKLARQLLAHRLDVVRRRRVVRLEADQDVGVLDADRPRIVVGHVDAADAEPDIVDDAVQLIGRDDLADRFADPVGELGGLFDPRAGLRPHMHLDLAAIDAREEVLAEIRGKREREQGEAHEPGDQLAAVVQTELEQTAIARCGWPRSGARSPAGIAPADCGWAWQG